MNRSQPRAGEPEAGETCTGKRWLRFQFARPHSFWYKWKGGYLVIGVREMGRIQFMWTKTFNKVVCKLILVNIQLYLLMSHLAGFLPNSFLTTLFLLPILLSQTLFFPLIRSLRNGID